MAQVHSYSQLYPQQAVFALDEPEGRLYAAGGAAASTVHTWDMSQERCTRQVGSCACSCSDVCCIYVTAGITILLALVAIDVMHVDAAVGHLSVLTSCLIAQPICLISAALT